MKAYWALCAGLLASQWAYAAEPASEEMPDAAMLEYLGEWASGDGEDVDPSHFDDDVDSETGADDAAAPADAR